MRKCRNCLCRTCLNLCCDRKNCPGKKKECKRYGGFRQMSIFEVEQPKPKKAPRHSWEYYGITRQRYKELTALIRSGRYASLASSAAHSANKDIASYIILSIEKNLSYEGLQRLWELKEIERMPESRTNFYAWRRYTYHLIDLKLKKMGK